MHTGKRYFGQAPTDCRSRYAGMRPRWSLVLALVMTAGIAASEPPSAEYLPLPPASSEADPTDGAAATQGYSETLIEEHGTLSTHGLPPIGYLDPAWEPSVDRIWLITTADLFVKIGSIMELGNGFFEDRIERGWGIQLGARQPIGYSSSGIAWFGELGVGYMQNSGDRESVITSGEAFFSIPPDDHTHPLDEFFFTRLEKMQRASLHAAIGGYYAPQNWNQSSYVKFQFMFRGGARLGHLHMEYAQTPTPELQAILDDHHSDDHFGPGQGGHDPEGDILTSAADDTDIFVGVFTSIGVAAVCPEVQCLGCHVGTIRFAFELEFAHDWFELGEYGRADIGLGTLTPMFSVSCSY